MLSKRLFLSPFLWKAGSSRFLCSRADGKFLQTTKNSAGFVVVKMRRPPANGLNLDFLTELTILLEKLEDDHSCRGMILTSALPGIFSAGIDMGELTLSENHGPEHVTAFWQALQTFIINLYKTHLVTIATITGHAPAGGCLLSLVCDYRVMAAGNYTIGISAVRAGLFPPAWIQLLLADTIGRRQAELSVLQGKLYSPQEALKLGLVDKVVPETDLQPAAESELRDWLQVPDAARILTKSNLRRKLLQTFQHNREREVEDITRFVQTDSFQNNLKEFMRNLKNRSR
ncbi:enoyl-CoA delta isomerase 1, mitochondrial-like [Branchiostoma floridae x Branchiostoma japonicum]